VLGYLLLIAALQTPEPPRTVNDEILGTAEEFATRGPARVCLMSTSIDLLAAETAYLEYMGIHSVGVRIVGPGGTFRVRVGAWAKPRSSFRTVRRSRNMKIQRHRVEGRSRYLFYARSEDDEGGMHRVAWVEGDAFDGSLRDRRIYERINVNLADINTCQRRFVYGWEADAD
jgi:hypothetical protein